MNNQKVKKAQTKSEKNLKNKINFESFINYFNPKFTDIDNQKVTKKFPWDKIIGSIVIFALIIGVIIFTRPDFQNWTKFWKQIAHFFDLNKTISIGASTFTPQETFIRSLEYLWTTISYSVLGTILGILFSVPLALLSSKNFIKNKLVYYPFRAIMSIIRAIPPIVFAFIFFFLFSKGIAATISISIFVCSIMTKWLYEDLDTYDTSAYQGAQAIGNTKTLAFKNAIYPYLIKRIVSYGFYSFEMVVRFAAILSIVGISTIGQLLSDQYATEANFSHMSIALWTLIALMILIETLNFLIKKYILEYSQKHPKIDDKLPYKEQLKQLKEQKSKMYIFKIFIIIFVVSLVIASLTQIEWEVGNSVKISQFKQGFPKLFKPEWSLFQGAWKGSKTGVFPLGFEALMVAFASSLIGLIFAFFIGILAAKNITKYFSYIFKLVIIVIRAIPAFTFALLFIILSKDSKLFAGVLALGIHSIGMLGKLIMESTEKIPNKVFQSLDSLGATWFQKVKFIVLKSIMPQALSNFMYRVEINFKSTVVIGAVGASDFGFQINTFSNDPNNWNLLSSYLIFSIVVLLIIEQISNIIRSKLMTGYFFSQDVWFKKIIKRRMFTKALAVSQIINENFTYEVRNAKYILAKHNYHKLFLLNYFEQNKQIPTDEIYQSLKNNKKTYLQMYKDLVRQISKEINEIYWKTYKLTKSNLVNTKNLIIKHKEASKSARMAIDNYFERKSVAI
ncbi:PhnE/PtxC family ABC transporter permease [Mycoplasma enhydrae]|uniref:PhnE/PtxC family ABC transporter permease n=1 Tax=Mycoplasma enhydrae TaxID=2499220 RepID=UPI00197C5D5D|nr:ABC transporter permease subunit [Mycoplasma enhydrae]MBN4089651.1 ABC transporter permease subunit [Mycoplasma enhydrae]